MIFQATGSALLLRDEGSSGEGRGHTTCWITQSAFAWRAIRTKIAFCELPPRWFLRLRQPCALFGSHGGRRSGGIDQRMCQKNKDPDALTTIFKASRKVAGAACLKAAGGFFRGAASPLAECSAFAIFSANTFILRDIFHIIQRNN